LLCRRDDLELEIFVPLTYRFLAPDYGLFGGCGMAFCEANLKVEMFAGSGSSDCPQSKHFHISSPVPLVNAVAFWTFEKIRGPVLCRFRFRYCANLMHDRVALWAKHLHHLFLSALAYAFLYRKDALKQFCGCLATAIFRRRGHRP
jgi:hypothetical protein